MLHTYARFKVRLEKQTYTPVYLPVFDYVPQVNKKKKKVKNKNQKKNIAARSNFKILHLVP